MKTKILNIFAASLLLLLASATGLTQTLIYSNVFNGQAGVTINGTAPTFATNLLGGTNNAIWVCTYTNSSTLGGTVYGNGYIATNQGCALLPFMPQPGAVYFLSGSIQVPSGMGSQVEIGFTQTNTQESTTATVRFNDTPPNGYAWMFNREGANDNFFAGARTGTETGAANLMPTAGTYTWEVILNTLGAKWTTSAYINGVELGTNVVYGANPPIAYCGIGQATFATVSTAGIQWFYFTLSTALAPIIIQQPTTSVASANSAFTNMVTALADTNGGTLYYQWYTNGVAISNATNATLVINPVIAADASTNYYVIITNTYGAVTSLVAGLTVNTSPSFSSVLPIIYTNTMTLYGGTNVDGTNYVGSNPTFSVSASGAAPIFYQWQTNGVSVGGATNTTLTFTNCQLNSPTNITCIATNSAGAATNTWSVRYLQSPMAPFPQSVLALNPIGYWRLNETDCCGGQTGPNDGAIATDYAGGNNGIYTNMSLGWSGYNPTNDPLETSAQFGEVAENSDYGDSDANSIAGINFATNTSTAFTVEAWVAGYSQTLDAGIVTLGWGGGGEQFDLDTGANDPAHDFRFLVRDAGGTLHTVSSTISPLSSIGSSITPWYQVVGVVDEISNQTVSLYVNGALVGTTSITNGSGIWTATNALLGQPSLMSIGSRMGGETGNYNYQFYGNINDVAVFNYALTPAQVGQLYQVPGGVVAPYFLSPLPITNFVVTATNTTLTILATAFGPPPIGYNWTDLNTGVVLQSGVTNIAADLNATLSYSGLTTNMWGDVLELIITNSAGSTNLFVTLSAPLAPPPPPMTIGYTNSILYSNAFDGAQVTIGGTASTLVNSLVGGTNSAAWVCTSTNSLANSNGTVYADGSLGTNDGVALVPFTAEPGYIYTMTASLAETASMGNWVAMGFTEFDTQTNAPGYARFTDNPPNGYGWMYLQNGNAFLETGPRTTGPTFSISGIPTSPYPVTNTLQLILNTVTNNGWYVFASVNGVGIATNIYSANLPIAFAGLGQNQFAGSYPTMHWIYWTLSQVAPGGVPPYLIAPLPSTNSILLTNGTVTVSATAYGSGPLGYFWSNNSAVIASGTTNNTVPISANLSVLSSSLSAGQLTLTVTNAYGTNVTLITVGSPINSNSTNIVWSVTNNNLYLSWPTDHTGWQLQAQTNSLSVGISSNWVNVAASSSTNQVVVPINLTNGSVFYRLIYTP